MLEHKFWKGKKKKNAKCCVTVTCLKFVSWLFADAVSMPLAGNTRE